MAKITVAGGGQFAELEKFAERMRNATAINPEVLRGLQSLHPSAAEAAARMQEFGKAIRCCGWLQSIGRTNRAGNYYGNLHRYQSQPAELRRATQLEF